MTTLAATLSIDARGASALYLITDSRITWDTSARRWDTGQKTFASRSTPDIFGFCGDAYFPPAILRQILERVDLGLLALPEFDSVQRHEVVTQYLKLGIESEVNAPIEYFSIFHGFREGISMQSTFHLWHTQYYAKARNWTDKKLDLSTEFSTFVHVDGSGRHEIKNQNNSWAGSDAERTSRAAIWTFCDALSSGVDPCSGGAPQLVGLWRVGNAKTFGMVWNGRKYISGLEIRDSSNWGAVNWFNSEFERCDGSTGEKLASAQAHTRPLRY